jgi:threonine/homoserine efflux transporter RhtA
LSGAAAAFGLYFAEGRRVGRVEANIGCAAATLVAAPVAAPVRVIPDVARFGAELEAEPFVDRDGLE